MQANSICTTDDIVSVNSETPESEVEDEGRIHDSNDEGQSDMDSDDAIDDNEKYTAQDDISTTNMYGIRLGGSRTCYCCYSK